MNATTYMHNEERGFAQENEKKDHTYVHDFLIELFFYGSCAGF